MPAMWGDCAGWIGEIGLALARACVLLAMVRLVLRPNVRRTAAWWMPVIAAGLVAAGLSARTHADIPYDFKRFWQVGRDLNRGVDYYALPVDDPRELILNPPTALPLFRVLALMPLPTAAIWWHLVNVLGVMLLFPTARALMRPERTSAVTTRAVDTSRHANTDRRLLMLFVPTLAVAAAPAHAMGLALGQLSLLATFALLMALRAQSQARPVRAGIWLAIATIKVHTLLPFLLLFSRRRDGMSWASMCGAIFVLCALGGPLSDLPGRCLKTLEVIERTHHIGQVNDYGYEGPSHVSLVGLDHALYRCGLTNRAVISVLRNSLLAAAGLALAGAVVRRRLDRPTSITLVALFACVFLYHRLYDALILVLPIAWALNREPSGLSQRIARADSNRCAGLAGVTALLVLYVQPEGLLIIENWSFGVGAGGGLVRAMLLSMATWYIVIAGLAIRLRHRVFCATTKAARSPRVRPVDVRPDAASPQPVHPRSTLMTRPVRVLPGTRVTSR